ncbi:DnaA regulatory inactivator Hda [Oxalobacteraceae bacterium CAVE-383]|nr:DnaA regulatory inactivator Hda [Oxalobacteraceae bacterium CAVE-383]
MRQLLLDLSAERSPDFETFVIGRNVEACHLLKEIGVNAAKAAKAGSAAGAADAAGDRFIYLWGEDGSGKSHLLHALAAAAAGKGRYIGGDASGAAFDYDPAVSVYLIDDCERLSASAQIDAFNLFNRIREQGGFLVGAGESAPAQLKVREDLRTRLGWGLIYQIQGLSDEEKIDALTQAAAARGMILSPGLLPYLITHFRRDMRSLSAMLEALDRYSLETKRPITLPLLRSLLQMELQERTL